MQCAADIAAAAELDQLVAAVFAEPLAWDDGRTSRHACADGVPRTPAALRVDPAHVYHGGCAFCRLDLPEARRAVVARVRDVLADRGAS